ncbi:M20/M25/M40 family metallo-hydrolase [Ruminococcaceae bacterium OttesenSCG-928-A16]|nr:M20/M25/M40 family metallo-hydrolase [Ruminococcaceae bacterium OttesenSCG-928-A16]
MIILYILLALLGVVALLLLAACINTLRIKNKTPLGSALPVNEELAMKYAKDLGRMLQCETVNDPGADPAKTSAEFAGMRRVLAELFPLSHQTLHTVEGLGDALLMRWQGKDPKRGAIVLMAHSDVVPATGEWKYPPFSGEVAEGCVWGRGAVDTKGSLCAIFEAVETLLAEGFTPPCDVYISSSNNEETMGDGAPKALAWLQEQGVSIDVVSDEGGAILQAPLPGLTGSFAMLGIVEKGFANLRFTAKSTGGHASMPPKGSPIVRLAAFVNRVEKKSPFKKEISKPVRDMFRELAPYMRFGMRLVLGNIWLFGPLLKVVLPKVSAQAGAMLQTTCAFTMASGSEAANVMPETASVTANLRFIMHQPGAESIAVIKALAAEYGLETEVLYSHDCSPYVDIASSKYQYMMDCVKKAFPDVGVAPYIMLGGTDARHFAHVCPCTVRFAPLKMNKQQLGSMHGLDENVDIDALAGGVGFYLTVLRDYV